MKFEIKNKCLGGYKLFNSNDGSSGLIKIGNISLGKYHHKHLSYCLENNSHFDFKGIPNALCGKTKVYENKNPIGPFFNIKRIVVIQMKD